MYFRKKTSGGRAHLQIVESRREGAVVRQQVIATLGRIEDLQESGQLERLLRSGALSHNDKCEKPYQRIGEHPFQWHFPMFKPKQRGRPQLSPCLWPPSLPFLVSLCLGSAEPRQALSQRVQVIFMKALRVLKCRKQPTWQRNLSRHRVAEWRDEYGVFRAKIGGHFLRKLLSLQGTPRREEGRGVKNAMTAQNAGRS